MNKITILTTAIILLSLAILARSQAADDRDLEPRDYNLSSDIDTWYEGQVIGTDLDTNLLILHGSAMPHATQHARMIREIAEKTANLPERERAQTEADIRAKWERRFTEARSDKRVISDRKFTVPDEAALLDERDASNITYLDNDREVIKRKVTVSDDGEKREEVTTYVEHRPVREERLPLASLRDLHNGDHVMIGYVSDPRNPDTTRTALAVIRERPFEVGERIEHEHHKGEVERAGRTMEHGLEKGANKIKNFFTGHDD